MSDKPQNSSPEAGIASRPPRKGSSKGQNLSTLLLVAVFLIGLCLLLYPTISDAVNSITQTRVIADHEKNLSEMDDSNLEELLAQALEYNRKLAESDQGWYLSQYETGIYNNMVNPFGNGMMGYIEIPGIQVRLPIYHGVDEAVLQVGIGHLESTSLPVGGESSHCVLSGHRGLPSARLFTDLDQLVEGDVFYIHVLNQTLVYQVDNIRIVEPEDLSALTIEEGKDYCTLVTCTPYGVNTHRLLVRGVRVDYTPQEITELVISGDATLLHPTQVLPLVAAPLLVILLIVLLFKYRKKA